MHRFEILFCKSYLLVSFLYEIFEVLLCFILQLRSYFNQTDTKSHARLMNPFTIYIIWVLWGKPHNNSWLGAWDLPFVLIRHWVLQGLCTHPAQWLSLSFLLPFSHQLDSSFPLLQVVVGRLFWDCYARLFVFSVHFFSSPFVTILFSK